MDFKKILSLLLSLMMLASLIIPASALEQPDAVFAPLLKGKQIELDGMMREDEGWEDALIFDYAIHANDSTPTQYIKSSDRTHATGSSQLRVKHDGAYLYLYYETSNSDTLNTVHYRDTNGDGVDELQGTGVYLRIVPVNGVNMKTNHGYTDGTYFHLRLNLGNAVTAVNEDKVGSIYDFTFTDAEHTQWGLGTKTPINQFGFYGYYDSYGDYSTGFAKNTTIALHVEKDDEGTPIKKSYEIKMPLSDTYKSRIGSGEPTFYLATYERAYNYQGAVREGSYLLSEDGSTPIKYDNSTNVTTSIPVTLENSKNAVCQVGFQTRTNPDDAERYDVRFVSVINEYEGFTLEKSRLGYLFRNKTNESEQYCTKVYEELRYVKADGSSGVLRAADFGGRYFYCFTVSGFEKKRIDAYELQISCFTQKTASDERIFCDKAVSLEISYDTQNDKPVLIQPSGNDSLINLGGYQIVIPFNSMMSSTESLSAYELKDALEGLGVSVTVNSENVMTSIGQKTILMGNTSVSEGELPEGDGFVIREDANGRIQIAAGSYYGYREVLAFIREQGGIPKGVNRTVQLR